MSRSVTSAIRHAADMLDAAAMGTVTIADLRASADAVIELAATQRDTLRMLEAAQRQLGMYSADNPRVKRAIAALDRVGGAA